MIIITLIIVGITNRLTPKTKLTIESKNIYTIIIIIIILSSIHS